MSQTQVCQRMGLDLTVLAVALPVLVADLKATTTELQWIMDSYILVLAALLLPAGSLGDRVGPKRVLVAGLGLFLAGSLLCAYAWSAASLIGFRAFMGLGGAIVMPLTWSVLPAIFSEQERPKAIAVWSVASGVSVALGPIVGGWLLGHYFWGSIFLFNVPFIAAALVAVVWLVPESRDPQPRQADPAGALLAAGGLTALVYAIIEQPARGWDPVTLTTLTAGIALLAAFAAWEARSPHPVLNVRLFANPRFTWATAGFGLVGLVLTGTMFLFTQYLQDVEGYRPFDSGLQFIPLVLGMLAGAQAASRLLPRTGAKVAMAAGFALLAAGLALFSTASVHTDYGFVALCLTLMGAGLGTAMTPGLDSIMGAMPAGESGAGSAVASTFRQVGAAIGAALLGDIYLNSYVAKLHLPPRLPAPVVHLARQSVGAANAVAAKLPAPWPGRSAARPMPRSCQAWTGPCCSQPGGRGGSGPGGRLPARPQTRRPGAEARDARGRPRPPRARTGMKTRRIGRTLITPAPATTRLSQGTLVAHAGVSAVPKSGELQQRRRRTAPDERPAAPRTRPVATTPVCVLGPPVWPGAPERSVSGARPARMSARPRRCRPGGDGRSWLPGRPSFPATGRSSRAAGPARTRR
jgi:EmrB/QacA subfamily drug resistance transporter